MALVGFALLVGWTRVWLLDHYLSDVVGSVVLGALWVAAVAEGAEPRITRGQSATRELNAQSCISRPVRCS